MTRQTRPAAPRALVAAALVAALTGCAGKATTQSDLPDPVTAPITKGARARPTPHAAEPPADDLKSFAEPLEQMFRTLHADAAPPADAPTDTPPATKPPVPRAPALAPQPAAPTIAEPSPPAAADAPAVTPPAVQSAPVPTPTVEPASPQPAPAPSTPAPQPDPQTLDIPAAYLCLRVDGFGRYTTVPSYTFLAGRTHPLVVYTEVEHFTTIEVPAPGEPGATAYQVELTQAVTLYLDSDGSKQLAFPETPIKDVARARRRDFFLVQRIELPRNLSVGNYNLKVAVRDVASKAVAEAKIDISVVADAGVARAGQRVSTTGPRTPLPPPRRP